MKTSQAVAVARAQKGRHSAYAQIPRTFHPKYRQPKNSFELASVCGMSVAARSYGLTGGKVKP